MTTRSTAFKLRIKDIVDGKFIKAVKREEQWEPNYLITPLNENVSRVRVLGTVVSKFISEDGRYGSVTLDDGSDTIAARCFKEEIEMLERIKVGDIVDVVGRIREYEDEKYLSPESIREIDDPNWELVRQLELIFREIQAGGKETATAKPVEIKEIPQIEVTEELITEKKEAEIIDAQKHLILKLIEESQETEGVKYVTLLSKSGLDEAKLESIINELMEDGEVYEPKIGRFRRV